MSDVEKRIEQWRAGLAGSELLRGSDVHELESHLWEEMEHLKAAGLSDEEAFAVARSRLGDTPALEQEFGKVNDANRLTYRLGWMIAGVLIYMVAVHFAGTASQIFLAIAQNTDLAPHTLGAIAVAARIVCFCLGAAVLVWLGLRWSQPRDHSPRRIWRRLRLAFLLAVLVETVCLGVTRICGAAYVIRTTGVRDYAQIAMVESFGDLAWRIVGPVLLAALLLVIHLVARRNPELD